MATCRSEIDGWHEPPLAASPYATSRRGRSPVPDEPPVAGPLGLADRWPPDWPAAAISPVLRYVLVGRTWLCGPDCD